MSAIAADCVRCHVRPPWSAKLCWYCHRAYAAEMRHDRQAVDHGLARGIVLGLALVAGAVGLGAPFFVAIAVVPIALGFGSFASTRQRRAWIERTGELPTARALPGPDSDKRR